MKEPVLSAALYLALAALVVACGGGAAEPVARLTVPSDSVRLEFGESSEIDLLFSPLVGAEMLGPRPVVFVHLLDGEGTVIRTFDRPLEKDGWRVGADVTHRVRLHQSYLAPPLRAGSYELTVGLYEAGGEKYSVASDHPEVALLEFAVSEVVVGEPSSSLPSVQWTGDWQPLEPTGVKQVLVRRWLGDGGGIRIEPVERPTELFLDLNLLRDISGSELSRTGEWKIEIVNSCGDDAVADQEGRQELLLALEPPADGGACEIELVPDFLWEAGSGGMRRSVLLEVLTLNATG